jgi:probable HAF family extracellular repeat protein
VGGRGAESRQDSDPPVQQAAGRAGFLLIDGRLVRLDVPGAMYTQPLGINNRGQVVGEYQTPDGRSHGFRWDRGRFTTFDDRTAPRRQPSPTSTTAARWSVAMPTT